MRLEDHLECVCTSQHNVVEHSDAETGNCDHPKFLYILLHNHIKCPSIAFLQKNHSEAELMMCESLPHPYVIMHRGASLSSCLSDGLTLFLALWLCTG